MINLKNHCLNWIKSYCRRKDGLGHDMKNIEPTGSMIMIYNC